MTRIRPDRVEVTVLAFIAVLAIVLLNCPRFVGVADQGDFFRMMYWGKFAYPPLDQRELYIGWINRHYSFERNAFTSWRGYPSSEALFVKTAALVGFAWSRSRFDLLILGLVHVTGFVTAWALLLPAWRQIAGWSARVAVLLVLIIFCDIGYLAYFHSFYSEPASLIFLVMTLACGLIIVTDQESSVSRLVLFYLAATFMVTAKVQNAPFALALAAFAVYLHSKSRDRKWRRVNLAGFGVLLILAVVVVSVTPSEMRKANLYNSVFNGILRSAVSAENDLVELGLPKEYAVLNGTTSFHTDLPIDIKGEDFRNRFYKVVSSGTVLAFYIGHPDRFLDMARIASDRAYTLQPPALGNFEKSTGLPYRSQAKRWRLWSQFKQGYLPHRLAFTFALISAILVWIGFQHYRHRNPGLSALLLSYWLMLVIAFLTPIPGDGENDLEKHLFNFNAILDLFVVLAGSWLIGTLKGEEAVRYREP